MNKKYILLAGIWFGQQKPSDMSLILGPVLNKIKMLCVSGKTALTPAGEKQIKAVLLAGVFDLPAKAAVLKTVQFNGMFGCIYCKDKGVILILDNTSIHPMIALSSVLSWR